jgi:hypothetical protein
MKFDFHPEALTELEDAAHHYRSSQDGLGFEFYPPDES